MVYLKIVWAFLRRIPWQVYAALALAAGIAYAIHQYGDHRAEKEGARVQALWDASEEKHRESAAKQAAESLKIETRWRADYAAAVERLQKENKDALAARDSTIADLNAGTLRLRERFRCPAASVPATAANPSGTVGTSETGLLDSDARFFVHFASEADGVVNKLSACQAALRVR